MDSSDFSNMHEEDEDIKLFREEYPDIYDFVLRLIDGVCDEQKIRKFIEEYDKETFDDIKKMIVLIEDDEDVERLKEEYPEEFYNAIRKMVHRIKKHPTPAEEYPKITTYKKGDFIGQKYEVYNVLGEGGFGIVYLVYSQEMESVYALKTFRDEYLEDLNTRERFKKEAQVWIELERHPYLVRAYFVEEISGRLYIAMEHIASDETGLNTLEGYLRIRPPDLAQSLRWAIQFCHGMEHAYSRGIKAHRDIKPANIMIGQDKAVKISDFGLAGVISASKSFSEIKNPKRTINGETYQTMEGTAFGTPPYMPPEQFENAVGCDERSDIYSFGIVLYQMASGGKLPFLPEMVGDIDDNLFQNWYILHCKAPVPRQKSPLFPVIQKCLEKEPRKRYQAFKELRTNLEPLLKRDTGEFIHLPEKKEKDAWEWNMKGGSLVNIGKYKEAIVSFDKALEIIPCFAEAWANKGIALKSQGKLNEALECFNKSITCYHKLLSRVNASDINLHLSRAWHNKGNCLNSMGYFKEAISDIKKALELAPNHADSLSVLGNSLMNLGQFDEAVKSFEKALNLDPKEPGAWYRKGLCLDNLGQNKAALYCYDQAIALNPLEIGAWYSKAICLSRQQYFDDAYQCIEKVIEINQEDAFAWFIKAGIEESTNKKQDAVRSYRNFIALASDKFREEFNYAQQRIKVLQGSDSEAIRIAKEKLKKAESTAYGKAPHGVALNNLASALVSEGEYLEAENAYKEAISIIEKEYRPDFPQLSPFLNNLAQLYYSLDRYVEAQQLYLRSINIIEKEYGNDDQNLGYFLTNLAVLYVDMGKYSEALDIFQRALDIKEKTLGLSHLSVATTLEHYASCLRKIGENDKAKIMEARARKIRENE